MIYHVSIIHKKIYKKKLILIVNVIYTRHPRTTTLHVSQYGEVTFLRYTPMWSLTLLNNQEEIAFHRALHFLVFVSLFHFRIQEEVNKRDHNREGAYKNFSDRAYGYIKQWFIKSLSISQNDEDRDFK